MQENGGSSRTEEGESPKRSCLLCLLPRPLQHLGWDERGVMVARVH